MSNVFTLPLAKLVCLFSAMRLDQRKLVLAWLAGNGFGRGVEGWQLPRSGQELTMQLK